MKNKILPIWIFLSASIGIANAQSGVILSDKTGWHRIGQKTVDFSKEKDEIAVTVADRFAAIKFLVKDAPITLNDLEITFESGDHQHLKINNSIKLEGESRVIDIKGSERNIKKITFTYKTLPNYKDKKARVEIWGKKTNVNRTKKEGSKEHSSNQMTPPKNQPTMNNPDPMVGSVTATNIPANEGKEINPNASKFGTEDTSRTAASPSIITSDKTGWHKIAERKVDFKTDRDEILVLGANRFSAIKFKSLDAPIMILGIKLNFDRGDVQEYALNTQIDPGKESIDITLNEGKERDLKRISFFYKTVANYKDEKGNIEVWGYKTNEETQSKR